MLTSWQKQVADGTIEKLKAFMENHQKDIFLVQIR